MPPDDRTTLIVAAHPDDEVLGAGMWMLRHRDRERITILHVTDGSPRNLKDARAAGCATREEYAALRRRELHAAVGLAGIRPDQCRELGYVDQEAYLHLPELVQRLRELIGEIRPEVVIAHSYEGGHPDHDAIAFAVAHAVETHWEFAGYHAGPNGSLVTGEFLNAAQRESEDSTPPAPELQLKQAMVDSFASQRPILDWFDIAVEKFRRAPQYDFTKAPHEGELLYERFGFAKGAAFRAAAAEALEISKR